MSYRYDNECGARCLGAAPMYDSGCDARCLGSMPRNPSWGNQEPVLPHRGRVPVGARGRQVMPSRPQTGLSGTTTRTGIAPGTPGYTTSTVNLFTKTITTVKDASGKIVGSVVYNSSDAGGTVISKISRAIAPAIPIVGGAAVAAAGVLALPMIVPAITAGARALLPGAKQALQQIAPALFSPNPSIVPPPQVSTTPSIPSGSGQSADNPASPGAEAPSGSGTPEWLLPAGIAAAALLLFGGIAMAHSHSK